MGARRSGILQKSALVKRAWEAGAATGLGSGPARPSARCLHPAGTSQARANPRPGPHNGEAPGITPGRFVLPACNGYSSSSTSAAVSWGCGTGSSTRGGGASKPAGGWMSISA